MVQTGGSKKALEVREAFFNEKIQVAVPDLVFYELSNVMRFDDSFSVDMVNEALQSLRDMGFQIVAPYSDFMNKSVENASKLDITVYDSAFYTLAELVDGKLVTVDKELCQKTQDSVMLENFEI